MEDTVVEYVLIAIPGKTDPIRSEHDGPILHIVRNYKPKKVYLILTEEIGKAEAEYHLNEGAIQLLNKQCGIECEVELIQTKIIKPHSYDDLSEPLLKECIRIKEENSKRKILLNITSGTPQMETAMCMIAISDPERYVPVQVSSPQRSSNNGKMFNPKEDLLEDWFETNMDNEPNIPSRCSEPQLWNFKRPIIQMQIESLICNYDYAGALQLYEENKGIFSEVVGELLRHAKKRLNLEHKEAQAIAEKLQLKQKLYPIARSNIAQLVEFFSSMEIKQYRGELNDLVLRLEIMTEYLGVYILENCMKIKLEDITIGSKSKNSYIMFMAKGKCIQKMPGIKEYLDEQFSDKKSGQYEWGKALNALTVTHLVAFMSKQPQYKKFEMNAKEMLQWSILSNEVRNPAAHTITSITEDTIKQSYGKDSMALCKSIKKVLMNAFGGEVKKEGFESYEQINSFIKKALNGESIL